MEAVKGPGSVREEAFSRLVAQYQSALLRACYVMLGDYALAEDAVQETFFKAYRAYASFRGESLEKTWLTRIAVNTCRDVRRRSWFRMAGNQVSLDQVPEPSVPFLERDDTLIRCVMRLPAKEREAVLLYYYNDLTMNEISHTLRVPLSTVGSRLDRARKRLKAMLKGEGQDEG